MTDADRRQDPRRLRLRYAGRCEVCDKVLPARSMAWYEPARKRVRCVGCPLLAKTGPQPLETESSHPPPASSSGVAGASARREYERRSSRHHDRLEDRRAADRAWREEVRRKRPLLGRIQSGLRAPPDATVPQNVLAWKTGSDGEQRVGRRLDDWAAGGPGRFVLHDRRIPGTRANIDHLVVAASGVWVIDAKEYAGRVHQINAGGMIRPDFRLKVGGRNRSKLAEGVIWQRDGVIAALDRSMGRQTRPLVAGMLCFVGSDWGLFPRPFVFGGVWVAWPAAMTELLSGAGSTEMGSVAKAAQVLQEQFPSA